MHQLPFILTYRFKRDLKNGRMTPAVINCVKQVKRSCPPGQGGEVSPGSFAFSGDDCAIFWI